MSTELMVRYNLHQAAAMLNRQAVNVLTEAPPVKEAQAIVDKVQLKTGWLTELLKDSRVNLSFHDILPSTHSSEISLQDLKRIFYMGNKFEDLDAFLKVIKSTKEELLQQKQHWQIKLKDNQDRTPLQDLKSSYFTSSGELKPIYSLVQGIQGQGGTYRLVHKYTQQILAIIKPIDEDILCLNNAKGLANPCSKDVKEIRVRKHVPMYQSAMHSALAYKVAELIGIASITPKADLVLIDAPTFFDIGESLSQAKQADFQKQVGSPDKEKLCGIQTFVSGSQDLSVHYSKIRKEAYDEAKESWLAQDFSERKIEDFKNLNKELLDQKLLAKFDRSNLEDILMFSLVIGDMDGHFKNFITTFHPEQADKLFIQKVDNDLAFPEKVQGIRNVLLYFPHLSKSQVSDSFKDKITGITIKDLVKQAEFFELSPEQIKALEDRVMIMQDLVKQDKVTYEAFNQAFKEKGGGWNE